VMAWGEGRVDQCAQVILSFLLLFITGFSNLHYGFSKNNIIPLLIFSLSGS
jgi:hypothetical protein